MTLHIHGTRRALGFSLIEILIAVVILATGLLALTALQGRLAQASSEAKTRSRVASMLVSRVDQLRAGQYDNTALDVASGGTTSTTFACASGTPAWVCSAQTESSVGSLQVVQSVTRYLDLGVTGPLGTIIPVGAFTQSSDDAANLSMPEFKRIILTASWTDASNGSHRLSISTDVSPLSLRSSLLPNQPAGSGTGNSPVVRQENPAGPGVIPIAIGGGDATAASNPRPEIIGKDNNASVVGTRFDVLTYNGISGASVIQRRVETAAIACTCQYGAGGTNLGAIYQKAQWPAEWTGERYEITAPAGATLAPGDMLVNKSGPASGFDQSALCTECCRDHHDATGNTTKFDPVRTPSTDSYAHYNADLTAVVSVSTTTTPYLEACRLVRVDGFWRTATDMYAKHFGLINTTAVAGVAAKSAAPDTTAVTNYQSYVKSYLAGYTGTVGEASIANADDGGQVLPTSFINITAPPPADERYLHARGLYVDYLTDKALARIRKARETANCTSGDLTECTLPYLPFTTINNTELSYWEPRSSNVASTTVLTVATGSSLVYDPLQPVRGRTNAKSTAANGSTADATALITRSNAGVAIASPVDPDDSAANGKDQQAFQVTASGTPITGENFTVRLAGPSTGDSAMAFYDGSTSNDPAVAWENLTGNANCNGSFANNGDKDPNDYACNTFGTLGIATSVQFANYFRETTVSTRNYVATCGGATATDTVSVPTFYNYALSAASVGGNPALSLAVTNDAKTSESTIAAFASVPSGAQVDATFVLTQTLVATIASCTTNNNGNQINNIVWTRSWTAP